MKKEYIKPCCKVSHVHNTCLTQTSPTVTVDTTQKTDENLSKEQAFSADEEW